MQAMRWLGSFVAILALCSTASAQNSIDAQWIWFDEGDPANQAPAGKVYFRREVRAFEPSTGIARVAADDRFTLWANGQKIGSGGGDAPSRFSLSGIVERGLNVIAVEGSTGFVPAASIITWNAIMSASARVSFA